MAVTSNEIKIILQAQSNLAAQFGKDTTAARSLASSMGQIAGPSRAMATALQGAGSAADTASKQFANLQKSSSGIGDSLKQGLAVGAGFGIVSAGVGLVTKAFQMGKGAIIDYNAQIQSAEAAFTGLLGSSQRAKSFLGDLQKFAATTPFEFPDVVKAAQRFTGMGVAAERVIPLLKDVGTVVAAFGGTSESINRVTIALSQMMARGRVAAGDMNQLTEAGIPAWSMLAKALDLPIAKVRELSEEGKISSEVMLQAIHDAANTDEMRKVAELTAKSWNAAMSNMTDGITMFIGGATRPMFEELTKIVGGVGDWLVKSQDAKTVQMGLVASVRALGETFGPMIRGAVQAGEALLRIGAALPIFDRIRAAFAGLGKGGGAVPAEEMAEGLTRSAVRSEQLRGELEQVNAELTAMPKQAAAVSDAIAAAERSMKNNAVAIKAVEGGLRETRAAAEEVTDEYTRQEKAVRGQLDGIEQAQAGVKAQVEATKAAYDAQAASLRSQQSAVEAQQQATRRQAEDLKTAYEDLAGPIQAALAGTETQLRDNKTAADDVRAAYAAQIDPLERALATIKGQIDLQRQQEDLAFRIRDAELARAKVAAIGDPIERAKVAAALDQLDARKDALELEKQAADIRKRLSDDKDVSPQEREILKIDLERLDLKKKLEGMTDQQRLAEIKVAQASLDAAKDQQGIARAQEDLLLSQHKQVIDGLKAEEQARLDVLGKQRTELERQASDQKAMLDGLKTSLEAALAPLEARAQALARQHEDIANSIKAVEEAERRALAPLEARGKELDRQKAAAEQQIKNIKAAEEAALEPIRARQKELEKIRDGLQAERDALAAIKADNEDINAGMEKRLATAQAIQQELQNPPPLPELGGGADSMKELDGTIKELSASFKDLNNNVAPVVVAFGSFSILAKIAPIILGVVAAISGSGGLMAALAAVVALLGGPLTLALAAISVAIGVFAAAWAGNWGDIQAKTQAFIDWFSGPARTAVVGITVAIRDAFVTLFASLPQTWTAFAEAWVTLWADIGANLKAAWDMFKSDAEAGWKKLTDWFDGDGRGVLEAAWALLWATTLPTPFKTFWSGLTGQASPGWDAFVGWLTGALAAAGKMWSDFIAGLPPLRLPWQTGGAPGMQTTGLGGGAGGTWGRVVPGGRGDPTSGGTHSGGGSAVDIMAAKGSPILAPVGGTSTAAWWDLGGNTTVIRGDDGKYYYIAHGNVPFTQGRVEAGQQIGEVGNTGNARGTDPHAHVAVSSTGNFNLGNAGGNGDIDPAVLQQTVTTAVTTGVASAAPLVQRAFQYAIEAGLPDPELFAAQIQQESGFNPNAVSSAGARGIGQFMPGTAEMVARQMGVSLEEFWGSVDLQLRGAALHMADLTRQFGSQTRALSAYYSGPGGGEHPDYVNAVEARRPEVAGAARGGMQSSLMLGDLEKAMLESFKIPTGAIEQNAAQVQNFLTLMSQDLPTSPVADALMLLSNSIAPIENAVANGTMSLDDLARTLVEMGARAGLSNEPLEEMQAGLISSRLALQEMVAGLASADPRFAELLKYLDESGSSTAEFALRLVALLKTLNQPIPEAAAAALPGVAPGTTPGSASLATLQAQAVTAAQQIVQAAAITNATVEQLTANAAELKAAAFSSATFEGAALNNAAFTNADLQANGANFTDPRFGSIGSIDSIGTVGSMTVESLSLPESTSSSSSAPDEEPDSAAAARSMSASGARAENHYHLTVHPRPGDDVRVRENFETMRALWGDS